jgi:RNA polymerase sigma factor (sigma-70 family)
MTMTALEGQALLDHGKAIARRYARRVGPELAEELQAEAIARALGSPPPDGRLEPWLERIYRNLFVDLWRRGTVVAAEVDIDTLSADGTPEDEVLRRERRRIVRSALRELPRDGRRALLSKYFRDEQDEQAAGRFGVSAVTVRTRIHRALARLRDRLGEVRACLPMLFGRLSGQLAAVGIAPVIVAALLVASNPTPLAPAASAAPTVVAPTQVARAQVLSEEPLPAPVVRRMARPRAAKPSVVVTTPAVTPTVAAVETPKPIQVVSDILSPDGLVVFADPEPPVSPCMVEPPAQFLAQIEKMVEERL